MEAPKTNAEKLAEIRKYLDRSEKLAIKAEAVGVTAEEKASLEAKAKEFQAKAFELSTRYEIDMAIARAVPGAEKEGVTNRIFDVGRPFTQQLTLAYVVYSTFGNSLIDISTNRSKARRYGTTAHLGRAHAFGFDGDMQRADMLFTSLVLQAQREAARRYRQYVQDFTPWQCPECGETEWKPVPRDTGYYYCTECHHEFYSRRPPQDKPDRRSVWYRSFWIGWVNALAPRIRAAHLKVQEQAVATVGTGAEVALRSRDVAVQEEVARRYPELRQRRTSRSKGSGYHAGREAGSTADIGQDRLGVRRDAIGRGK